MCKKRIPPFQPMDYSILVSGAVTLNAYLRFNHPYCESWLKDMDLRVELLQMPIVQYSEYLL